MNSILTTIAVVLIAVLFGALIGPYFVPWESYRDEIQQQVKNLTGQDIKINGDIDVILLPVPNIKMFDVEVAGSRPDFPLAKVEKIIAEFAIAPLLKGQIRAEKVLLDRPLLTVAFDESNYLDSLGLRNFSNDIAPDKIAIKQFSVSQGTMVITDEEMQPRHSYSDISLLGSAGSLLGPYQGKGVFSYNNGSRYGFRASVGKFTSPQEIKASLSIDDRNSPLRLKLEGLFGIDGNVPVFDGELDIANLWDVDSDQNNAEAAAFGKLPWELSSDVKSTADRAALKNFELSLGPENNSLRLNGIATAKFGDTPKVDAIVSSRYLDLDRFFARETGSTTSFSELSNKLGNILPLLFGGSFQYRVGVDIDGALLNGDQLSAIGFELDNYTGKDGAIRLANVKAQLPGVSQIVGSTAISGYKNNNLEFDGELQFSSKNTVAFTQWLDIDPRQFKDFLGGARRIPSSFQGQIKFSEQGVNLQNVAAKIGESDLAGQFNYSTGQQTLLEIDAQTNHLKADGILQALNSLGQVSTLDSQARDNSDGILANIFDLTGDVVTRLKLKAKEIEVGGKAIQGIDLNVQLDREGVNFDLIEVENVAGTSLHLVGHIDDVLGEIYGKIRANLQSQNLVPLAELLGDLGFGDKGHLIDRARVYRDADLKLDVTTHRGSSGDIIQFNLDGLSNGSEIGINANLKRHLDTDQPEQLIAKFTLQNPDSNALLQQLGLTNLPNRKINRGATFNAELEGPADNIEMTAYLALGTIKAEANGQMKIDGLSGVSDFSTSFQGDLIVDGQDLRTLGDLVNFPAMPQPISGDFSAEVDWQNNEMKLTKLAGQLGENLIGGELAFVNLLSKSATEIKGQLDFDLFSLAWLSDYLLGVDIEAHHQDKGKPSSDQNFGWSKTPFSSSQFSRLLGSLKVEANNFYLTDDLHLEGVSFDLKKSQDDLQFKSFTGSLLNSELKGNAKLSNQNGRFKIETNLQIPEIQLSHWAWATPDGSSSGEGAGALSIELSGRGRSWLGIVSSLQGQGLFEITNGVVNGVDPSAFDQMLTAVDEGFEIDPEKVSAKFSEFLSSGVISFDELSIPFSIINGSMVANNIALEVENASLLTSTSVDLTNWTLMSDWRLTPKIKTDIATSPPAITFAFEGPVKAPKRKSDFKALTAYLTVRKLEQDVKKLEAAEAAVKAQEESERELLQELMEDPTEEEGSQRESSTTEKEETRVSDGLPADSPESSDEVNPSDVASTVSTQAEPIVNIKQETGVNEISSDEVSETTELSIDTNDSGQADQQTTAKKQEVKKTNSSPAQLAPTPTIRNTAKQNRTSDAPPLEASLDLDTSDQIQPTAPISARSRATQQTRSRAVNRNRATRQRNSNSTIERQELQPPQKITPIAPDYNPLVEAPVGRNSIDRRNSFAPSDPSLPIGSAIQNRTNRNRNRNLDNVIVR